MNGLHSQKPLFSPVPIIITGEHLPTSTALPVNNFKNP